MGVSPLVVRLGFLGLSLVGGVGILLYVAGWLLLPRADATESIAQVAVRQRQESGPVLALGMLVLGVLLLLRQSGMWFDDGLVWPVVLAAMGLYVIWRQADDDDRAPIARVVARLPGAAEPGSPARSRWLWWARVVSGTALFVAGTGLFLAVHGDWRAARDGMVAAAVVAGGLGLVFGPWWWRLARALASERRERIRSDERAEVAAHLHDSVLQTLALIQRRAGDPRAVTTLARSQERELRGWLYGEAAPRPDGSLAGAVTAVGAEVEALHEVTVDVVTVGDCPLDDRLQALLAAGREALANAARWSGTTALSAYVEVEPDRVSLFVRDRGVGFDPAAVNGDHQGIAESIVGRMARHGGRANVRSRPGEGTEVELVMPRARQ